METSKNKKNEKSSTKAVKHDGMEKTSTGSKEQTEKLQLKRQVNLLGGVSIIIGSIIGSGIFISPKGLLQYSGSAPVSLIIWTACGIISLFGALCFAELGTLIPLSGGDYIYLLKGFEDLGSASPIPAFLFLWISIITLTPSSSAILSLTVAEYIIEPLYPNCASPFMVKKLVAVLVIYGIPEEITTFEGSETSVKNIAIAIYFGMWAYSGWNSLNNLTEELIEPEKNILRAIVISLPVVTICYILTNIAYLTAMSPAELLSSDAVALLFANNVFGKAAPVIPVLVAASAYGCALVGCLGTARLAFVAAREGHLLDLLSYIHVNYLTPVPAVIFNTIISVIFISLGNFNSLINFLSFSTWLFLGLEMIVLMYMRWSKRDKKRIYKANLLFPIIMLLTSIYLVFVPIIQDPQWEYLYACLFILAGLLLYIPFVHYKIHLNCIDKFTFFMQCLLLVAPSDKFYNEDSEKAKDLSSTKM
ncbi:b(0,+)-type amino acid transporter 1-like isoform X2 [Centruroides vittatus]|uniref:b(0,+)-type amino acid transporter 1-like isoform X2 n=1 Tax=Centruroides vittatus TaxID=120091 RepID=UPI00350FFDEC